MAKKRSVELLAKQNETDLKLAKAVSLNTAQVKELTHLRAALEACEEKWYNEGFVDAKNSAELIMNQARRLGFEARWFAALQVLGVPEDSSLRNPGQIPFPSSTPTVQNPSLPIDEEKMVSMRELLEQIDAYMELDETEATGIPCARDQPGGDLLSPTTDQQQIGVAARTGLAVPTT